MTLTDGTRLGRYQIRSKIGEGGMGEVYIASEVLKQIALEFLETGERSSCVSWEAIETELGQCLY